MWCSFSRYAHLLQPGCQVVVRDVQEQLYSSVSDGLILRIEAQRPQEVPTEEVRLLHDHRTTRLLLQPMVVLVHILKVCLETFKPWKRNIKNPLAAAMLESKQGSFYLKMCPLDKDVPTDLCWTWNLLLTPTLSLTFNFVASEYSGAEGHIVTSI